jgi:hypothetical protein
MCISRSRILYKKEEEEKDSVHQNTNLVLYLTFSSSFIIYTQIFIEVKRKCIQKKKLTKQKNTSIDRFDSPNTHV